MAPKAQPQSPTRSNDLRARLTAALESTRRDQLRRELLLEQRAEVEAKLQRTQVAHLECEKARELLNTLVSDRKRTTLDKIEKLVTYGLRSIFENDRYTFKVNTGSVRKQIVYSFELADGSHDSVDLESERGGGIVNVTSFLLAVVIQLLLDPEARTFVFDERFSHVSARFVPNVAQLLTELAERMRLQFLHVTHQEDLADAADVTYLLKKAPSGEATAHPVD